jgi:hypothetical protein
MFSLKMKTRFVFTSAVAVADQGEYRENEVNLAIATKTLRSGDGAAKPL